MAGCDNTAPPTGDGSSATLVRNRRDQGWSAGRAWRLTVIGRIGGTNAEGPGLFGRVVDVGIDALGRLWVADGMQQQLKIFQLDGTLVRSIGRKGGGPAEFGSIAGFDWSPDGMLWTLDGGNARFAIYDSAGRLVATRPRTSSLTISPWPGGFDRAGNLLDVTARWAANGQRSTALLRYRPDGTSDTLQLPSLKEEYFGEITSGGADNRRVNRAPVPFSPSVIWRMDPRGYAWVAVTDRYRLERLSSDGTVERAVELENEARRVSRADKEQILRNYRWFEQAGGKLDPDRIPDRHPHLLSVFFDDEEHLWVAPTYLYGEKPLLDVFDLNGRFLGQVRAPVPFLTTPAPAIRDGLVAAVARDADGVDSVILMRLEKPAG